MEECNSIPEVSGYVWKDCNSVAEVSGYVRKNAKVFQRLVHMYGRMQ